MANDRVRRLGCFLSLTACTLLFGIPSVSRAQQAATPPSSGESEAQRTAWFRQAKFGMFIHWGPYSLASVEASWPIMTPEAHWNITEAEYVALYQRFNPVQFDPQAWVSLATEAGMRYMVFTTKHHDGFCMFDTALTDYKITKTPYGRDVTAMLAKAAHDANMPLGFYYSPPGYASSGLSRYFQTRQGHLARRSHPAGVGDLPRLHGCPTAGTPHRIRPGCLDLV